MNKLELKFINTKKTFPYNLNGKFIWISYKSEAKIEDNPNSKSKPLKIKIKDLSNSCYLSKEIFKEYFELESELTPTENNEFNLNNIIDSKCFLDIAKNYPQPISTLLQVAIKKAHIDSFKVPGSRGTISIKKYKNLTKKISESTNKLKTNGSPFFNRRFRWAPVANLDDWDKHGKPAPIGIRESDYASLEECNKIFKVQISQIFRMKGLDSKNHQSDLLEIEKLLGTKLDKSHHKCYYCGLPIDINLYKNQEYKAKIHGVNFCHRDPNIFNRTNSKNIYIGHTSCNRIQGGLSERDRILEGLKLLILHEDKYITIKEIKQNIMRLTSIVNSNLKKL